MADGGQNPKSKTALENAATLCCGPQVLKFVEDLARAPDDFLTNRGNLGPRSPSLKQGHAQIGFNLGQLRRQARLTDIELRRGQADLSGICHGNDVLELAQCWTHYGLKLCKL